MSKIYMVIADNGESWDDHAWWNVKAFASKEAAQKFIDDTTAEIGMANDLIDEFEYVMKDRKLTDRERKQYDDAIALVDSYWGRYSSMCGYFEIQEFELCE